MKLEGWSVLVNTWPEGSGWLKPVAGDDAAFICESQTVKFSLLNFPCL